MYLCSHDRLHPHNIDLKPMLLDQLIAQKPLSISEFKALIEQNDPRFQKELQDYAEHITAQVFHKGVYIRALLEISNICENNCYYCGIRKDNQTVKRYRLRPETILSTAHGAYQQGFRTLVMQGGESQAYSASEMGKIILDLKHQHPDMAITLSLGEFSEETYRLWKNAGADRYLLRHESYNPEHYAKIHPKELSFEHRMNCLHTLKTLGYQTGAGFMVGSPFQTTEHLAHDLKFIQEFKPAMIGLGPFIPAPNTPFQHYKAGSTNLTLRLLSLLRIINPYALIPATTALSVLSPQGRLEALRVGANVVMPNVSPKEARESYQLYVKKDKTTDRLDQLEKELSTIGYHVDYTIGDYQKKM